MSTVVESESVVFKATGREHRALLTSSGTGQSVAFSFSPPGVISRFGTLMHDYTGRKEKDGSRAMPMKQGHQDGTPRYVLIRAMRRVLALVPYDTNVSTIRSEKSCVLVPCDPSCIRLKLVYRSIIHNPQCDERVVSPPLCPEAVPR